MKLAGEQLVLDTNILVHLLRGKQAGQTIERMYLAPTGLTVERILEA